MRHAARSLTIATACFFATACGNVDRSDTLLLTPSNTTPKVVSSPAPRLLRGQLFGTSPSTVVRSPAEQAELDRFFKGLADAKRAEEAAAKAAEEKRAVDTFLASLARTTTTVKPAPLGATARCKDGTHSFSQNRSGTCSGHGGVAQWL